MMTWDRLRVFAAVAEHASIGAAAEALHLTGPAVSQHVRKLEREAGDRLIEPNGRGIRLTTAGRVLASSARTVAGVVADAERDLANLHDRVAGPLRLGGVPSALRTVVPEALRTLTAEHERLELTLIDGEVVDMIPELSADRLDAVVMESWSNQPARMPPGVHVTDVLTEDVALAVSDDHPLAHRESVTLGELDGQTWTSCPPGTDPHEALVQRMRARNIDPHIPYCAADYVTQVLLVAARLAVAMVPRMARTSPPDGVRFIPCEPAVTRTIAVAAANDTPAVRAFVETLTRTVPRAAESTVA